MYFIIGLATVLAGALSASAQTCYFPNGNEVPSDTACNPNALVSACCFDGQACLSNGLCVSDPNNTALARTHRGTCTDRDWKSGNCPRHCLDVDDNGTNVYSCNSTSSDSYCCFDNCECTDRWETFSFSGTPEDVYTVTIIGDPDFELQTAPPSTGSSAATASSSATSTASSNSAVATTTGAPASATSTSQSDSSSGSSNSTAIGVGVGVGVGAAALIAAAAFFFYRRKKRNSANAYVADGSTAKPVEAGYTEQQGYYPPATKYAYYGDSASDVKRMTSNPSASTNPVSEMPAHSNDPVELPAGPTTK